MMSGSVKKNRLKEVLHSKKMTQKTLAEMMDVSRAHISDISRNDKNITLQTLFNIAEKLEVPAYTLVGDYAPPSEVDHLVATAEYLGVSVSELLKLKKD